MMLEGMSSRYRAPTGSRCCVCLCSSTGYQRYESQGHGSGGRSWNLTREAMNRTAIKTLQPSSSAAHGLLQHVSNRTGHIARHGAGLLAGYLAEYLHHCLLFSEGFHSCAYCASQVKASFAVSPCGMNAMTPAMFMPSNGVPQTHAR